MKNVTVTAVPMLGEEDVVTLECDRCGPVQLTDSLHVGLDALDHLEGHGCDTDQTVIRRIGD